MEETGTKIFVQDNATCHTAKSMKACFDENKDIELLIWPPQSADMNPIENLWDLLKHEAANGHLQGAAEDPDHAGLGQPG